MSVTNFWLWLIPILYASMMLVEIASTYSRYAGCILNKNAVAYSIQNATFSITRMFYIFMMPAVGFIVDRGVEKSSYVISVLSAYFLAAGLIFLLVLLRSCVLNFYVRLVEGFVGSGKLLSSAYGALRSGMASPIIDNLPCNINKKLYCVSIFVYTIHAIGVFSTFYLALQFPDNRVMITQLSGAINALGTALLTFKIDPYISRKIEGKNDFPKHFYSILYARLTVFLIFAPFTILVLYWVV